MGGQQHGQSSGFFTVVTSQKASHTYALLTCLYLTKEDPASPPQTLSHIVIRQSVDANRVSQLSPTVKQCQLCQT